MRGLQGNLEERAKMAAELLEENNKLREEMDALKRELTDLKDKNNYLDERVEVFKQLLEQENLEKEENQKIRTALQTELQSLKEEQAKTKQNLDSENQKNFAINCIEYLFGRTSFFSSRASYSTFFQV